MIFTIAVCLMLAWNIFKMLVNLYFFAGGDRQERFIGGMQAVECSITIAILWTVLTYV